MSLLKEIRDNLDHLVVEDPEKVKEIIEKVEAAGIDKRLWLPNPGPQTMAYKSQADVLYYGGAAGGGKSQLMLGLASCEHRVSRLFRRQFTDIDGEGGLAPGLQDILGTWKGYNSQRHVWRIPNDMTEGVQRNVEFGAFTNQTEAERYQGRAADFFAFDEAVQFQEDLVEFIIGWNRTTIPGQRCRTLLASNPPVTPEGLWIFDWFAPWLDPEYPDPLNLGPAKPGELRYFTKINGIRTEVDKDWVGHVEDAQGNLVEIHPKSYTFIPASLSDNIDLLESGYASQLASLPAHLQDALLKGQFDTTLEDRDLQIIPTEWVLKAQSRWQMRKQDLESLPMDALGVDVADGGKDRMAIVGLHGATFTEVFTKPGVEVDTTEKKAAFVLKHLKDDAQINIDAGGGYGGGLADMLLNNELNVKKCKGAFGSEAMDRTKTRKFHNKRVEYIWRFREALDPENGDNVALPPGRHILMELTAFEEDDHPEMRDVIKVKKNEKIVEKIGRSPDLAWAFFFAWAEPDLTAKEKRQSYKKKRRGGKGRTMPKVVQDRTPKGHRKPKGQRQDGYQPLGRRS